MKKLLIIAMLFLFLGISSTGEEDFIMIPVPITMHSFVYAKSMCQKYIESRNYHVVGIYVTDTKGNKVYTTCKVLVDKSL